MTTLRYERKLAAVSWETQEPVRNSRSQNTSIPRNTEEYIRQVFEDIESRLTKNCPKNSWRQSPAFWVLFLNYTIFSWARKYGRSPEPFRDIPEHWLGKPRTNWGLFPEWSPYRSGVLCLLDQQFSWLWPGRDLSQHQLSIKKFSQWIVKSVNHVFQITPFQRPISKIFALLARKLEWTSTSHTVYIKKFVYQTWSFKTLLKMFGNRSLKRKPFQNAKIHKYLTSVWRRSLSLEDPEIISAEQHCFRRLYFFSAVQLWFGEHSSDS